MVAALSHDVRWRIIWKKYESNLLFKDIGAALIVDVSSVSKYLEIFAKTGDVLSEEELALSTQSTRGRYPAMPELHLAVLLEAAEERPYLFLDEYAEELTYRGLFARAPNVQYSKTCICKALFKLGLTRQKLTFQSHRISALEQQVYADGMKNFFAEQLCFLDETRRDQKSMQRRMGRAPSGVPPVTMTVPGTGPSHSILALTGITGFLAWHAIDGGYDAPSFLAAFEVRLLPHLRPFPEPQSVLVLDNCSIHHAVRAEIERLVAGVGARIFWLPAYSPWLNPIEAMFAQLKAWFRRYFYWCCADTRRAIEVAMKGAVSIRVAVQQYEKSGYRCSPGAAAELAPYVQGEIFLYG